MQPAQDIRFAVGAIALHPRPVRFGEPFLTERFEEAPAFVAEGTQAGNTDPGDGLGRLDEIGHACSLSVEIKPGIFWRRIARLTIPCFETAPDIRLISAETIRACR